MDISNNTSPRQKPKAQQTDAHSGHSHIHHDHSKRPHPLSHFFGCCLGEDPAPLSKKIQDLRKNLPDHQFEEIKIIQGEPFLISADMIVGDILFNFPQTREIFQEIHPLGLLSPILDQTTIEMFLADLTISVEDTCTELNKKINQKTANG